MVHLYPQPDVAAVLHAYRPWYKPEEHSPHSLAQRLQWIAHMDPAPEIEALVLHQPSATPLGFVCLGAWDHLNAKAELSVAFFRGRGSRPALEALHWVFESAFAHLQLHKLIFCVMPDNTAAQQLLASLGVGIEAVLREEVRTPDGQRSDLLRYALLRQDWLAGQARTRLQRLVPLHPLGDAQA